MNQKIFTIVATKDAPPGTHEGYDVLSKEMLVKRIEELTDENFGYTILIATKDEDKHCKCPTCSNKCDSAGQVRMKDGNKKNVLVEVYYCKLCGWRGT